MPDTSASLKALHTQRVALATERDAVSEDLRVIHGRLRQLEARLRDLDMRIATLTAGPPTVSEHALLRYVERVLGYNLDILRATILPPSIQAQIETLGAGTYPVHHPGGGFRIVVKNNVVVTLKTPEVT